MGNLQELLAQREALEAKIAEETRNGKKQATQQIRQIAAEFGLTATDLAKCAPGKAGKAAKPPAAAKYRDPKTGATWGGHGKRPNWLREAMDAGKKLESFLIVKPAPVKKAAKKAPAKKAKSA